MKNLRFVRIPLFMVLFCLLADFATAQDAIPAPPACDAVLSKTQDELQKLADATCKSTTRCITCTEKKSGAVVYATLLAQPTCKAPARPQRAQPSAPTESDKPNTVAKVSDTKPAPPVFAIFQERCEDGSGVDLTVYIPGNAMECNTTQYAFLWEIDGGKGGHAAKLDCACGKTAQLTVTDSKTGLSQTKKVDLLPCGKR